MGGNLHPHPFLLGIRSEGSRILGRVHGSGRAATGNQAASWEEAQRPGASRTGRRQTGWLGRVLYSVGHSASGGLDAMHGSGPWWEPILPHILSILNLSDHQSQCWVSKTRCLLAQ